MKRALILFVALYAVWLLLSGHYTTTLMTYGALSCAAVVAIVRHLGILDEEALPVHLGLRHFVYLPWLMKEIVVSNLAVAKVILTPALPIHPRIVRVTGKQTTPTGKVIYANSITLTPGTITTGVSGQEFEIHALSAADLETDEEQQMDIRCTRVERGRKERTA